MCNIIKDIGDGVFRLETVWRAAEWLCLPFSTLFEVQQQCRKSMCILTRKCTQIFYCCCCFLWMRLWADFRHYENSRTIPPAASQSILLSKTSAKSASSCQSNQSSNLSGGGGAVKPRRKSLRQTCANTNFDKNSTQEYLPKYKKKYKCMWNESYKISRFLKSCVSACTPVELDTLHHFTPCPMLPWNI